MVLQAIPLEILQDILTLFLPIKTQCLCQTVCRSWYMLLVPFLYHRVDILGPRQFDLFFRALSQPSTIRIKLGLHVRELSLEGGVSANRYTLQQLSAYCPNLYCLKLDGSAHYLDREDYSAWQKHTLRRLEGIPDSAACYLLKQPTCLLDLTHVSVVGSSMNEVCASQLYDQLRSLPALASLELVSFDSVSLRDFEDWHASSPQLVSLAILDSSLTGWGGNEDPSPGLLTAEDPRPVRRLTTLRIESCLMTKPVYESVLFYIASKYPSLRTLELSAKFDVEWYQARQIPADQEGFMAMSYTALLHILKRCPDLTSLQLINVDVDDRIMDMLGDFHRPLQTLSVGDLKRGGFDYLQHMSPKQQTQLQSLSLLGSPGGSKLTGMRILSHFHHLTHLHLSLLHGSPFETSLESIPVDTLLKYASQLRSLTIEWCRLEAIREEPEDPDIASNHSLTELRIENVDFYDNVLPYVAARCPRLAHVTLVDADSIPEGWLNRWGLYERTLVSLKNIDTLRIDYTGLNGMPPPRFFKLMCQKQDQPRWFHIAAHEELIRSDNFRYEHKMVNLSRATDITNTEPHDVSEDEHEGYVEIQCHSVKALFLSSVRVV